MCPSLQGRVDYADNIEPVRDTHRRADEGLWRKNEDRGDPSRDLRVHPAEKTGEAEEPQRQAPNRSRLAGTGGGGAEVAGEQGTSLAWSSLIPRSGYPTSTSPTPRKRRSSMR